jgi:hypothetical protein
MERRSGRKWWMEHWKCEGKEARERRCTGRFVEDKDIDAFF